MTNGSFIQRLAGASKVLTIFVVIALFAAIVLVFNRGSDAKTITADFPQTTALYVGSEVRVLGVPVGTVTDLDPRGDVIRTTIEVDSDVELPSDVKAVIVSPAIVGDRFVQLAPAYDGGAKLKDGAHLDQDRTAVPVELDEIYESLDNLSVALGPDGANADGALSDLISSAADQFEGQGAQLNSTLLNFGQFSSTLANNSDELFSGVRQVEEFVAMLEANDATVRAFNDNTADVAEVLEAERQDLAATLSTLATALTSVEGLVQDNRSTLRQNVVNLKSLTEVLAARDTELGVFASAGPTALTNVTLAYNPGYGTLDTHANLEGTVMQLLTGPGGPARLVCALVGQTAANGGGPICELVSSIIDLIPIPGGETAAAPAEETAPAETTPPASTSNPATGLLEILGVQP